MDKSWIRKIIMLLVVIGFGSFLYISFQPQPLSVDMAKVDRDVISVYIEEDGYVQVRDVYAIYAPVGGRVLRIEANVGDPIIAYNTILTELLPSNPSLLDKRALRETEANVAAAKAAIALAKADQNKVVAELDYAESELKRTEKLVDKGNATSASYEADLRFMKATSAALESAKAMVTLRKAQLDAAKARLILPDNSELIEDTGNSSFLGIKSPVSGVVLSVNQESETVVTAGALLVEIGDPDNIEIIVDVLSNEAVQISENDLVRIVDWGGEGELSAYVARIEPTAFTKTSSLGIEEQRVNIHLNPADDHLGWQKLGHGYRIEAKILIEEKANILRIPISAIFRIDKKWATFVVEGGKAVEKMVDLGLRNTKWAEVVRGLEEGDTIILYPPEALADGKLVIPR